MHVSIIAAIAENDVIGRGNDLPWRLSADLRRFKRLTMGHHLIMGRRTFDSIGRPLPGRTSIVLSRKSNLKLPDGVRRAANLQDALAQVECDDEAFVIGGAQVYAAALPLADRIYLTRVLAHVDGDVRFPDWEPSQWQVASEEHFDADSQNDFDHIFRVLHRAEPGVD